MNPNTTNVVVLGAGVQGACVALALQRHGVGVTLIDQAGGCLQSASRVNEGKIHLGHVYANDETFRTAHRMLESALCFGPLLDEWLGAPLDWASMRSHPFTYVAARDSMVSTDRLIEHYEELARHYHETTADRRGHYLGERPRELWSHASVPSEISAGFALAAFRTPEVSLDVDRFGCTISDAVAECDAIATRFHHRVENVVRTTSGFDVGGTDADGDPWRLSTDVVVNCLWDGRLALDEQLGVVPDRGWLYRLKFRLLVELPDELRSLPSCTFVLGPFGDIVTSPASELAYLSWYPTCLHDVSHEVAPPASWREHFDGTSAATRRVVRETLAAFDDVVPGLARSRVRKAGAGVIFSWGATDIDDAASELHTRHDIGVDHHDGYFTINTGKFTSAPLFARDLVDRLVHDRVPAWHGR